VISLLKRHSWFFAAAGLCSLIAAGLPLIGHFLMRRPPADYVSPGWLEIGAFAAFCVALSIMAFDRNRSTWRRWISLLIQSISLLVMAVHDTTVMIFPLLVLVAWQATLMMHFYGALAWVLAQTTLLSVLLWPVWTTPACRVMCGIFVAFQFFGVFAARVVRAEASHGQELAQVNAELRATRALLANAVRTEERVRISRELHDAWGHDLTALNLQLEYASHLATGDLRQSLDEAKGLSRGLLTKVRDVVGTLNLNEGCDIAGMLQELASGVPRPRVHLELSQEIRSLSSAQAQVILRCVQEIITNAIKHADAKSLWIEIGRDRDGIRVLARDDGRGIESIEPGNGIAGMRERFEELGGQFAVASHLGGGFRLDAWFPHGAQPT
jgi:signal transduction histidine kinase